MIQKAYMWLSMTSVLGKVCVTLRSVYPAQMLLLQFWRKVFLYVTLRSDSIAHIPERPVSPFKNIWENFVVYNRNDIYFWYFWQSSVKELLGQYTYLVCDCLRVIMWISLYSAGYSCWHRCYSIVTHKIACEIESHRMKMLEQGIQTTMNLICH